MLFLPDLCDILCTFIAGMIEYYCNHIYISGYAAPINYLLFDIFAYPVK
jgi:hypothetical protein